MDYTDILKRSWRIIWRYKVLWIFGLFAGAGAGSGGGGNGGSGGGTGSSGSSSSAAPDWSQVQRFLETYAVVIVLVVLALILFAIVMAVLGAVARGGLIHLVNEAEEGRPVRAGDGWRVGGHRWLRVFGVGFLAGIPGMVFGLIVLAVVASIALAAFRNGVTGNPADALIASFIGSACLVIALAIPVVLLSVALGIASELGLRYAVIEDRGAVDSLRQGWRDLWSKRGAFLMYLVQIGVGIVYGIAVAIVAAILIVPGVLLGIAGAWPIAVLMVGGAVLVLMVPAAAYAAFYHAAWTIFFRKMTGLEMQPVVAAGAPSSTFPVAPPAPYPPAPLSDAPVYAPEPLPAPDLAPEPLPTPEPEPPAPIDG